MQIFYEGWRLVQSLCASDFMMPPTAAVHTPLLREVARIYTERRDYPVGEVLDVTAPYAQPHLLETKPESVSSTSFEADVPPDTGTVVAPSPQMELFRK